MGEQGGYTPCPSGAFPQPSWDGSEGGEDEIHMPIGITSVTEEHFFFRQMDFDILDTGYPHGGGWQRGRGGRVRVRERLGFGV